MIVIPVRRQEIAVQSNDDDDESFEPHADVYENRHYENDPKIMADFPEPEELGHKHIAGDHRNPRPLIRPERAVQEVETFIGIAAIPGDKELHAVGVTDD